MMADFETLKGKLEKTRRGALLLNEREQRLITTELELIETEVHVKHPLLGDLPSDAFVPENATISVLADNDVLSVFRECDAWSSLPQFRVAGARQGYRLNPARLTIGVVTPGGNAPGIDVTVDSLVKRHFLLGTEHCSKNGIPLTDQGYPPHLQGYPPDLEFYGIKGGYHGLQKLEGASDQDWVMKLHPRVTDAWATRGCNSLHSLRTESYEQDSEGFQKFIGILAENARKLKLDILYMIGGNGTLTLADALGKELLNEGGKPCLVVAAPKTMDADVNFTDVTLGFRTTVDNAIQHLRDFHREAETLRRVGLVELFGADSGFVALHAAYASGEADYVLIPEMMGDTVGSARKELDKALHCIQVRVEKRDHALLVVAEGATIRAHHAITAEAQQRPGDTPLEGFQHGIKVEKDKAFADLVNYFKDKVEPKVFAIQPKHLIRATPPSGFDTDLGKYTGKLMVDTALSGFTCCSVHLWQGNYVLVPLETAIAELKRVETTGYYFITMWEKYRFCETPNQ